jgi:proteasome accessory factor C
MLTIVPYLVQHPGTSVQEASRLFDVAPAELRRDLELLFLSGLPPYGPGDLIDVEIDEEDRITIRMADQFARPLRLTRQEGLAVALRAIELLATPGVEEAPALASALEKLRAALGPEVVGEAERIAVAGGGRAPTHLADVREAARDRRRLRIDYLAASTGELTSRRIDPEEVFAWLGHWYVAAWDVDADQERLFRIDRIRSAEPTAETFTPRGLRGLGRELYTATSQDLPVRLRLGPSARWVTEYYATTQIRELAGGSVEVTLPVRRLERAARLVLRLGPDAEVLDPPELVERVREVARATLARYCDGPARSR